jgi:hypothetical protein
VHGSYEHGLHNISYDKYCVDRLILAYKGLKGFEKLLSSLCVSQLFENMMNTRSSTLFSCDQYCIPCQTMLDPELPEYEPNARLPMVFAGDLVGYRGLSLIDQAISNQKTQHPSCPPAQSCISSRSSTRLSERQVGWEGTTCCTN